MTFEQGNYRRFSSTVVLAVATSLAVWLVGSALAAPADSDGKAMTSDQAFKNVQVLKGIPLDTFMGTMGVMTGISRL